MRNAAIAVGPGSIDHLSQVIPRSVAPSFLPGSDVEFISVVFAANEHR